MSLNMSRLVRNESQSMHGVVDQASEPDYHTVTIGLSRHERYDADEARILSRSNIRQEKIIKFLLRPPN